MKKKIICMLGTTLFCAFAAFSEEPLKLTVDDAVRYALDNNKSLKSDAIDLEIKKRASRYGWNTLLPSAGISATAARTTTNSTYNSIYSNIITQSRLGALETTGALSSQMYDSVVKAAGYEDTEKLHWAVVAPSISVGWNFNLAMIQSIRASHVQYEQGQITWEQAWRDMEVNVRKLFYGILLAQENLNIEREKLNNAQERYNQAIINYRNGLVPEMTVLSAQVTYENEKPTIMSAEQSLRETMDTFAFLIGYPFGTEIELDGSIETEYVEVDADELVERYLEKNKDIISLKKNIELLKISINAKRFSTFTPSLAVNYSFSPTLYAAGEWADNLADADTGSLSFTLVYSNLLDMLPFSANMQSLKDTKQQLEQAELGLEQLVQNMENKIHSLVGNLHKCEANIKAMEKTVELGKMAYDSTLKAYNNGTTELLDVRDSENSYNQARLGLLSEKNNYISALLELEDAINAKLR
ncbi:MAG: TolC family protein [Bacteroides sp.]|nr:TolC family protein [Prevotella sp.]MCM1407753.1 TolC family protein [Treponema brennaborense]MCM1469097.1 TolC family protein [Bacteroides sp.]